MKSFHNIERAHLEIAYDNGGIHRFRAESEATAELRRFLGTAPYSQEELSAIDAWLGTLSGDGLERVCVGEDSEQRAILADAPPRTDELLTAIFEEVC